MVDFLRRSCDTFIVNVEQCVVSSSRGRTTGWTKTHAKQWGHQTRKKERRCEGTCTRKVRDCPRQKHCTSSAISLHFFWMRFFNFELFWWKLICCSYVSVIWKHDRERKAQTIVGETHIVQWLPTSGKETKPLHSEGLQYITVVIFFFMGHFMTMAFFFIVIRFSKWSPSERRESHDLKEHNRRFHYDLYSRFFSSERWWRNDFVRWTNRDRDFELCTLSAVWFDRFAYFSTWSRLILLSVFLCCIQTH